MSRLLIEIGCEEIPARFMTGLLTSFEQQMRESLMKARINFDSIQKLGTYRRLVLVVEGVSTTQENEAPKTVLGPPKEICMNEEGEWQPAAIGFSKKMGVDLESVGFELDAKGRECLVIQTAEVLGEKTITILPDLLERVVRSLPMPIAMRWGSEEVPFVRPIHWICALLDNDVVPVTLYDVQSDRKSYGHRFLTTGSSINGAELCINTVDDYEDILHKSFVVVCPKKRSDAIQSFLEKKTDLEAIDPELLEEVTYLVEWPTPLVGRFDKRYLELPSDVLVQCMKKHQKYFPIYENGVLTNGFIVVAENVTEKSRDNIEKGNETVLVARLEDTRFFWEEDIKYPLLDYNQKLKAVVFQKNLGSLWDKKERIKQLAGRLVQLINQSDITNRLDSIMESAELSKADLVTQMVGELPSLQGAMGQVYAEKSGVSGGVALAIREQYMPLSEKGALPSALEGLVLGLADRLDTIVACFENKLIPTGSKDPWGIRKSMIAITRVLEHRFHLDLVQAIDASYDVLTPFIKGRDNRDKCLSFFQQRLKNYFSNELIVNDELSNKIVAPDTVDAILGISFSPFEIRAKVDLCHSYRDQNPDKFKLIVDTAVRVSRLVKEPGSDQVTTSLFEDSSEQELWSLFQSLQKEPITYQSVFQLSECLTRYFDRVLVMDKNEALKANRLAVLRALDTYFKQLMDAERLVV